MKQDPFVITGPTLVANSGGKTSGYNLWRHLQSNGGTLTNEGRAAFTNTGWEKTQTLDFLAEQEHRWGYGIDWLEFEWRKATPSELAALSAKASRASDRAVRLTSEPESFYKPKRATRGTLFDGSLTATQCKAEVVRKATKFRVETMWSFQKAKLIGMRGYRRVNRQTASTDGRPYQELLEGLLRFRNEIKNMPGVLPNGVQRICTGELKVRVMGSFAFDALGVGKTEFEARLGLRADEEERLKNAKEWGHAAGVPKFPLDEAGIVKDDVAAFWAKQPFGLTLKSHEGNCGGCYMKRRAALLDLIRRDLFDVDWWIGWERRTGQRFRKERSYAGLKTASRVELELIPPEDFDNAITCEGGYCTD